jgi:large subunit ribosomal protein L18
MAKTRRISRLNRKTRIRKKITGTPERPRLAVFRSEKHIYAQLIDDTPPIGSRTLQSTSSLDERAREIGVNGATVEGAAAVGKILGEKAKATSITRVVFDRGGYLYHGRVKALAEGAREAGLEF